MSINYQLAGNYNPSQIEALKAQQNLPPAMSTAQQGAQAGYNQAEGNLQNSYNQMQNTNMQNMANRFGGINTSVLNDQTYQGNRDMANAQGALANEYNNQLISNQDLQAQTNLRNSQAQQGTTQFNQQQALYNNPNNPNGVNQIQIGKQQQSNAYLQANPYNVETDAGNYSNYFNNNPYI